MHRSQLKENPFNKIIFVIAACFFVLAVFSTNVLSSQTPKFISIASYPVGAHGAFLATTFSEAITKQSGITTRPLPAPSDVGRFMAIIKGDAELGVFSAASVYVAAHGLMEFEKSNAGPQKVRLVFGGDSLAHGLIVKADSGIKKWEDLKGKRVAMAPGLFSMTVPAFLAYGGLDLDDVVLLRASGYVSAIKMVMSGAADACHGTPETPLCREMESSPYGLRYMPFDPNNKEAIDKMLKVAPFLRNILLITNGALGEGKKDGVWLPAYPYTVATMDSANEDVIYTVVKALTEGYNLFKDANPRSTPLFTLERTIALEMPIDVPFHNGLIKYVKEKGLWTDSHSKWQQEALNQEKKRLEKK